MFYYIVIVKRQRFLFIRELNKDSNNKLNRKVTNLRNNYVI